MSDTRDGQVVATRSRLAEHIARWARQDGPVESGVPGMVFFRYDDPTEPKSVMYDPSICLVAQGAKQVRLGDEEYVYDENHLLVTSVGLPVVGRVIEASSEVPLLGLVLRLDLGMLAQLLVDSDLPDTRACRSGRGMAVCEVSGPLLDSFQRLVELQGEPRDIPILAPLILKEILYRLLMSEVGPRLRQIATAGSHGQQIARAIGWLKDNYAKPVRVERLARESGMSVSTFHHHFRAMTAMSPLRFQKWLRLNEARRLMLTENQDVTTAALQVGYESPSQFSREYKRQFGAPPLRDIKNLNHGGQTEAVSGAA